MNNILMKMISSHRNINLKIKIIYPYNLEIMILVQETNINKIKKIIIKSNFYIENFI